MRETGTHPYGIDLEYMAEYIKKCSFTPKKILIIGAGGLIGSCLADALIYFNREIEKRFEITLTGRSIERLRKRFFYAEADEIRLWERDVTLPLETDEDYDYIFHLASNANPGAYAEYPVETIKTNVQGTLNVLEYARSHPGVEILFTSSMEVYGEGDGAPLREEDYGALNYNSLRAGYPESKRAAELMYRSAVAEYGVKAKIARMGYIYGPTMTKEDDKVVAQFLRKGAKRETLEMSSAGLQRRSYCYVADAVTAMLQIAASGKNGEVYNVADKTSAVTIKQLGQLIAEVAETELLCAAVEMPSEDWIARESKVLNTDKLEVLGWQAATGIRDGVKRTLEMLRRTE